MQPNEGVSLSLGAKIPGSSMRIRPVNMEFLYGSAFMSQSPEAYERLILDAMRGEATLFTRNDEVIAQWSIIDPILKAWAADDRAAAHLRVRLGRPGGRRRADRPAPLARPLAWTTSGARTTRRPARSRRRCARCSPQRHKEERAYVPARVMNMVVIVDKDFRGEIENRLQRVGRYHPSRLIAGARSSRAGAGSSATVARSAPTTRRRSGAISVGRERVELLIGERHLPKLDTIVDPLVVSDLATMVWSPHGQRRRRSTRCGGSRRSC